MIVDRGGRLVSVETRRRQPTVITLHSPRTILTGQSRFLDDAASSGNQLGGHLLSKNLRVVLSAFACVLVAAVADAHPLHVAGAGLGAGFAHPFSGLDHVLAMLAVGLWAAQHEDRRAWWLVPSTFVVMMVVGGLLGMAGVGLPIAEIGIAGSLLILGGLLALSVRLPLVAGAATVGLFAIMHGHSHGTEMPLAASPVLYGLGFVAATTILHATGLAIGRVAKSGAGRVAVRLGSAGIAAYGLMLLVG
jgi:urease accessory protein